MHSPKIGRTLLFKELYEKIVTRFARMVILMPVEIQPKIVRRIV